MAVFAEKGFENASLCDLTSAMKINRFSMYASFGNKEALYVKAMEHFSEARRNGVMCALVGKTARDGVAQFLSDAVERFTAPSRGVCFVTQAPLDSRGASPETRELVAKRRTEIEQALRQRLQRAVDDGELPAQTSAAELADFYSVIIQGIALQAQHGGKRDDLLRVVDVAMSKWPEIQITKRPQLPPS